MMRHKQMLWLVGYFILVAAMLCLVAINTIHVDPFFHYHKPYTDEFFYPLNNERSQNNGIIRHFDYTGLITGTSMTENFRTSEAESLWGKTFVKVPFSGGSFKEINDNVEEALRYNPNLSVVIRGLDMGKFLEDKDKMRSDLGQYPTYLYDDSILNDVQYIFNRDVIFKRVYPIIKSQNNSRPETGITSFDQYSNWMKKYTFGKNALFPKGIKVRNAGNPVHLSETEAENVRKTIAQNVTALAQKYADVEFYYFFTPYSAQWWMQQVEKGTIYRHSETERLIIESLLEYPNIKLFSFNCRFDLITDLNNYKDNLHYAEWINSLMLRSMHDDQYLLTSDNYITYLDEELKFYTSFDYSQLNNQPDYDDDYYAAFLLVKEAYGLDGFAIDLADEHIELQNAELIKKQHNGKNGVLCTGSLQRNVKNKDISISDYMRNTAFVGFKLSIDDITPYKFIVFYGKKIANHGQPTVYVYDTDGMVVAQCSDKYKNIKDDWKQYVINVADLSGQVSIIFNGGYVDSTGSPDSKYIFSDIKIY